MIGHPKMVDIQALWMVPKELRQARRRLVWCVAGLAGGLLLGLVSSFAAMLAL